MTHCNCPFEDIIEALEGTAPGQACPYLDEHDCQSTDESIYENAKHVDAWCRFHLEGVAAGAKIAKGFCELLERS